MFGTDNYLVEGICTDSAHKVHVAPNPRPSLQPVAGLTCTCFQAELAKLMLFQSSALESGEMTSFAEYTARMQEGQKDIYYVVASSREVRACPWCLHAGPHSLLGCAAIAVHGVDEQAGSRGAAVARPRLRAGDAAY